MFYIIFIIHEGSGWRWIHPGTSFFSSGKNVLSQDKDDQSEEMYV